MTDKKKVIVFTTGGTIAMKFGSSCQWCRFGCRCSGFG